MKTHIYAIALSGLLLIACGTSSDKKESKTETNLDAVPKMEVSNTTANKSLINSYLSLKNALIESNSQLAADKAKNLKNLLLPRMEQEGNAIKDNLLAMQKASATIALNADNIKVQRDVFLELSALITKHISNTGADVKLYQQYCPMYGEEGAFWLSDDSVIKNPYFGDKMLNCGSVEQQIVLK